MKLESYEKGDIRLLERKINFCTVISDNRINEPKRLYVYSNLQHSTSSKLCRVRNLNRVLRHIVWHRTSFRFNYVTQIQLNEKWNIRFTVTFVTLTCKDDFQFYNKKNGINAPNEKFYKPNDIRTKIDESYLFSEHKVFLFVDGAHKTYSANCSENLAKTKQFYKPQIVQFIKYILSSWILNVNFYVRRL